MAGLDTNMLNLIKCLAKNQIQDAKTAALACLANDNTKKNEVEVGYYTKLIKNGNTTMFELPSNVQGLMTVEDMVHFFMQTPNTCFRSVSIIFQWSQQCF